jgi:hypothetical protein
MSGCLAAPLQLLSCAGDFSSWPRCARPVDVRAVAPRGRDAMLHQLQVHFLNDLELQLLLQNEEGARGELDEQQEREHRREERRLPRPRRRWRAASPRARRSTTPSKQRTPSTHAIDARHRSDARHRRRVSRAPRRRAPHPHPPTHTQYTTGNEDGDEGSSRTATRGARGRRPGQRGLELCEPTQRQATGQPKRQRKFARCLGIPKCLRAAGNCRRGGEGHPP